VTKQAPRALPSPAPPAAPTPVAAPTPSNADSATPAGFRAKTRKSGPKREAARGGQAPAGASDASRKGGQGRAKRPTHPQGSGPKPKSEPKPKPKPKPEPPVAPPAPSAAPGNGGPPPGHEGEKRSPGH
jgi:hypothetical protein